jgi:hypothetical protein
MAKFKVDLKGVKPAGMSRTQHVPEGKYNVRVQEADFHETKSGWGIKFFYEVTEGEHIGKCVSTFLNCVNANSEENERISRGQLKAMMISMGWNGADLDKELSLDTDEFIGKELCVVLKDKEEEYDGNKFMVSEVKSFSKKVVVSDMAKAMGAPADAPTTTPSEAPKKKPWE